jgi:hypothetical protein
VTEELLDVAHVRATRRRDDRDPLVRGPQDAWPEPGRGRREALGVHQSLVSEYELGTVRVPATVLAAFAQILGTSLDRLAGVRPAKENGASHDRRFIRRLEKIDKLPKRAKQALLKTIDTYLVGVEKR